MEGGGGVGEIFSLVEIYAIYKLLPPLPKCSSSGFLPSYLIFENAIHLI